MVSLKLRSIFPRFLVYLKEIGATGAGKTFTMLGTDANPGIMALTLADLFNKIERGASENPQEKIQVSLSYLEIYNENIRDLLSGKAEFLDLRDDGSKGVVVAGITSVTANSAEEVSYTHIYD